MTGVRLRLVGWLMPALLALAFLAPHPGASQPAPHVTVTLAPPAPTPTPPPPATPPAASSSPVGSRPTTMVDLVARIKPAVVLITTYTANDQKFALGTGWFVAPDRIITNCHVIHNASHADVRTLDGEVLRVVGVDAENRERDVARLVVSPPRGHVNVLSLAATKPTEGSHVVVVGNPLGLEQTVSDGIVSSVRDLGKYGEVVQITAPVSPGNSGGPVVNMAGDVIGVVRMQNTAGQNLNFAVPIDVVRQLVAHRATPLDTWNQATAAGPNGDAAATLGLFFTALRGEDYLTAWSMLSLDSQNTAVRALSSQLNTDAGTARDILDGSGDVTYRERFWRDVRTALRADAVANGVTDTIDRKSDQEVLRVTAGLVSEPVVMVHDAAGWKVGLTETDDYNRRHR